jgi:hypothetical protein
VWAGGAGAGDATYEAFAANAPPFESAHDAARVIDALPPSVLGALLCEELQWLHPSGALRLRSSRKMYGVSLFPPCFDICSAVVHHLADYAGAHVDAGAGASTAHVEGLSTAGSLPSSVEGLMRALLVRGTPLTTNVVNLVRELTYRTLARRFPVKICRRPCNFLWDAPRRRSTCARASPIGTPIRVATCLTYSSRAPTMALIETGRRLVTVLEVLAGGMQVVDVAGVGWPVVKPKIRRRHRAAEGSYSVKRGGFISRN